MHQMHFNIPYMFDCRAYPVVHLLLLKSSMLGPIKFLNHLIRIPGELDGFNNLKSDYISVSLYLSQ